MNDAEIRREVEERSYSIEATPSWHTPAGNPRSSPLYEGDVTNQYLNKSKTVKARSLEEFRLKVQDTVAKWEEQEVRQRIVDAKRDRKERAQADAERRDTEAIETLIALKSILAATLEVDDKIDWDGERDTRPFDAFAFAHQAPTQPTAPELCLLPKPGLAWLLRGRFRRWTLDCESAIKAHAAAIESLKQQWESAVRQHEQAREAARREHAEATSKFLAEQERFNRALAEFRRRFEAGDADAIVEYCSQVLERSQYPDCIMLKNTITFDQEVGFVVVDLELPSPDAVPTTTGYKFVSSGNRVVPISLKKKESAGLYKSVTDQIILRTIHEVLEGCYVPTVTGVLLNAWVTTLDAATGNDKRKRVHTVLADRAGFETFDLSRVDSAACLEKLSESAGQMHGASA